MDPRVRAFAASVAPVESAFLFTIVAISFSHVDFDRCRYNFGSLVRIGRSSCEIIETTKRDAIRNNSDPSYCDNLTSACPSKPSTPVI